MADRGIRIKNVLSVSMSGAAGTPIFVCELYAKDKKPILSAANRIGFSETYKGWVAPRADYNFTRLNSEEVKVVVSLVPAPNGMVMALPVLSVTDRWAERISLVTALAWKHETIPVVPFDECTESYVREVAEFVLNTWYRHAKVVKFGDIEDAKRRNVVADAVY